MSLKSHFGHVAYKTTSYRNLNYVGSLVSVAVYDIVNQITLCAVHTPEQIHLLC